MKAWIFAVFKKIWVFAKRALTWYVCKTLCRKRKRSDPSDEQKEPSDTLNKSSS